MKNLTRLFTAAAVVCAMNVSAEETKYAFSSEALYVPIYMDDATVARIPAGSLAADFRIDDTSIFLYIWDNTLTFGDPIGPNSQGEEDFWVYTVGNAGWSGMGIFSSTWNCSMLTEDWSLVFGMATDRNQPIFMTMFDGTDKNGTQLKKGAFAVGNTPFNDNGNIIEPLGAIANDGEWHNVEISLKDLMTKQGANNLGSNFNTLVDGNILSILCGGTAGAEFNFSSIMLKGPKSGSVNGVLAEEVKVEVLNGMINVVGGNDGIKLYNVNGQLVKDTKETSVSTDGLQGIYILKSGNTTTKVCI